MLHDSSCLVLEDANHSSKTAFRRQGGSTHVVLDDQLLRDIIKVSLAHLLESIANFLLHQLVFFLRQGGKRTIRCEGIRALGSLPRQGIRFRGSGYLLGCG